MKMIRKQVYITSEQDEKLKRLAETRGLTEAEVVREALDRITGVTYEGGDRSSEGRLREVAVMEYTTAGEAAGSSTRGTDLFGSSLADKIWQEELAFLKSLGGGAKGRGAGSAWKFNREELYEERESQIFRRH